MGTTVLEVLPAESLAPPAPGEDRRITRSKRALRGALIALIEERGLDAITVNDLCERADLNRGTFYNHFHDKENLLTALENEVLAEVGNLTCVQLESAFKTFFADFYFSSVLQEQLRHFCLCSQL